MIQDLYFAAPNLLWAIPLLLVLGTYFIRVRAKNKLLSASRLVVFCLIIFAVANPYFVEVHTIQSQKPSITILDDKTGSMNVFDPDVTSRLSNIFNGQVRTFSGDTTPLGEKILQYSLPGQTIVLASDGYSNSGRQLNDILPIVRGSNATIFAIMLMPVKNDACVEIAGPNTAVLAGEYPFTVIVRSSIAYKGPLSVFADDKLIYSDEIAANGSATIKISHSFLETGNHILRASIASDMQVLNDHYQKVVYVVPKPEVLLISDSNSPLTEDLSDLYKLGILSNLPDSLKNYKTIILDDQRYSKSLDVLRNYVREGGGLVVVGGQNSYDLGGYRNSTLEEFLPVSSTPSRFEGGKTFVYVLDISFSLLSTRTKDGTTLLDYEKALAVEMMKSLDFRDYKVGLIVFGTKAYDVLDPMPLARSYNVIEERISGLSPTGTENTHLDNGLRLAWDMLNSSRGQEGELVVFSDGNLENYKEVLANSAYLLKRMNVTTRLIQVQAFPGRTGNIDELADQAKVSYETFIYPASVTTKIVELIHEQEPQENMLSGYAISLVNRNHYITRDLELNATITGFNDVTPKPGSQRLVYMSDGKPVLTAWRYGLGRVVALTIDDGRNWAAEVYASPNSRMISSMVNWAIGDPRQDNDRVEAEDGWMGTPLRMTITSDVRPSLPGSEVEKVGDKRYLATFTPNSNGVYYIGKYGVAVNYPLEYRYVGFNPEVERMIIANDWKVFTEDEARQSLIAEAELKSQRTVQESVSRRNLLLIFALAIILSEVIYRRIREIRW